MKRYSKNCLLLLFFFLSVRIEYAAAQAGDACNDALPVSFTPGTLQEITFNGLPARWLTFQTDTPGMVLEFSPDDVSDYANIESIELYSGNDCASKVFVGSQHYSDTDSLHFSEIIRFLLPEGGLNYFLKVNRLVGNGDGFKMALHSPDVMAFCPPSCPNIIQNPDFSILDQGCISNANTKRCPDPFNVNCICGWLSSHGTPHITSNSATMGVYQNKGEGIYQDLQSGVVSGRNYFLSFNYLAYSPHGHIDLNVQLGNSHFNAGFCFEQFPPYDWDIPNTPIWVNNNAWQTFATCFTANGNYSKLRFFPTTTGNFIEFVGIDKINLIELDSPIPDQTITCNEHAILTQRCVGSDPRIQYLWSTGDTDPTIWVYPTVTTQYTLTVSVVVNNQTICSYDVTTTVFVDPLPTPALSTGSTVICDPSSTQTYCFSSNGALQYSFATIPPNPMTPNGSCVDILWSNLPTSCGTIEVTAIAASCSTTQSLQVCVPCQGNPSSFTFCDVTASSILSDPRFTSFITGGNIFKAPPGLWVTIHGTFTVDVPFTFDNSDVRFGPDAKVVVNFSQVFEVKNGSHLHSCDGINMWDGIYTQAQASLVYIHDGNNLIEDAKNAIVSDFGGNFKINSTTFNNNFIGILVNTFWGLHPGRVWGCTFTGTGTLLSPYNGYCTMNYPACGIELSGVKEINIGEPSYYSTYGRNIFQNMLSGIYAIGSGMNVYTSEFHNMFDPAGSCVVSEGNGIYDSGNSFFYMKVNVGNQGINEKCIFNSCKYGIQEIYNFSGSILYNEFTNCAFPITNLHSGKFNNLVKGNVIDNFKRGIYFFNATNQLQYGLEIYENLFNTNMNTFSFSTYGQEAINVSNPISAATNLWVKGNVINYSKVGIFVRNVWEPCNIRNNIINFDILPADAAMVGVHHGIQCENDNGLQVDNNYIKWRNQHTTPSGFINKMNGISINYSSNTNNNSGGIFENKIGPYPAVNTGSTYGMGSGINISSDCMGLSLYCNKISRCEEGVTFHQVKLGPQGYHDIWWNWYSNGNTFKYTPGQGGIYRIGGTAFNSVDWPYVNASEDPHQYQTGTIVPFATTYSSYQCVPPAPLVEEERDDIFGMLVSSTQSPINPDYSGYEPLIEYATKEKFYASVKEDPSLLDAGVPEDVIYEELFEDLENTNIAKIQEIKTSIDSMDYADAAQKLSTLVDSNLYELNKKMVMEIYLESFASESDLDSSQRALLDPISMLHPLIGGEGVFWACAMLDKPVNNELPPLRKSRMNNGFEINVSGLYVFPNPASDELQVIHPAEVPLTLSLTDVTGKIVLSSCLNSMSEIHTVHTSMLDPGTYFLKLMDGAEIIFAEKVMIIK